MEPGQGISSLHRDLLLEISLLVSEQREIDEIFATFADHVRHGAAFEHASLLVITPDPGFMRLVGNIPQFSGAWPPGRIIPVADTGAEAALNQRDGMEYRPDLVETVATQGLAKEGFQRCWVMPLYIDDVLYGVFTVGKRGPGPFAEEDVAFLRAAGALLARTVHPSIELERAKRGEARAEAARELVLALQSGEPIEQIFERLSALLKDCLAVDYVGLFLQQGTVFPAVAEAPDHIYMGLPPDEAGAEFARAAAAGFDVSQGRIKVDGPYENPLAKAGYQRGAMAFLRDGSELRGLLVMARRSRRRFDPGELTFMELLRSVLAQSLINRQQVARAEGAAARARTLNDVALLLSRTDDLGASFDEFVALLGQAIEFDYAGLAEVIEQGSMRQVAARPELAHQDGGIIPHKGKRLAELLALGGMSQFSLRRYDGESRFASALRDAGMRRTINIALVSSGEVQGVLALARRNGARFAPEEEEFLRTLASMLGQAMEANSRLRRAETEAARQALLRDLASQMATGQSLEAFFDVLAPEVQRAIPVTGMVLLTATAEPGEFSVIRGLRRITFQNGRRIRREDLGDNVLGQFAAGAVVVEGTAEDLGGRVAMESHANGTRRGAIAVIRIGAEDVGYLLLGRDVDSPFLADERRFIELISALAGQVIANLRVTEAERAQSSRRRVLNDLALIVNDGQPFESHFARVCELLAREGYTFFAMTALAPGSDNYRLLRSRELPGGDGLPHPERVEAMLETGLRHVQFGPDLVHPQVPTGLFEIGLGRVATIVLAAGSRSKGLLTIGKADPAPFSDDEMTFFDLVGTLVAYAIASERRIAATTAEAEEQAILAAAAAAIARETDPLAITRALRRAAGLFIHDPYVTFGFLEPGVVEFVTRSGPLHPMVISKWFTRAFAEGQVIVPATAERVRAGEVIPEVQATGVQSHVLTTVTSGDSVVGLLVIGSRDENFVPGDREVRLCRLIADIAGPALANARIAQRKQEEAKEQEVLAEIAAISARESTPDRILVGLKAPLAALVPEPIVLFSFREADTILFPTFDGQGRRVPAGAYATLLDEKGQLHSASPPLALPWLASFRIHAICATAVRSAGATIGYFMVGSRDPSFTFNERMLVLCRRMAQVVGPAMENARATLRSRQDAEEQHFLAEAAAAAARATGYEELVTDLHIPFHRFVPHARIAFFFREGDVIYESRLPNQAIPLPARVAEVMEQEQSSDRLDEHLPGTRTYDYFHSLGIASWVDTTVAIKGEKIGLFFLGTTDPGYRFTERDLRLCRLTAGIIGPAMANLRESQRRQQDADDQRILAEAAAAAATGDTERAILKGLVEPIQSFIPEARITVISEFFASVA
ncbi:MAG TPA: GAF domain-containing protein, partial [Tepidiformaceae bacterium]|nr:GAF domain-containing protein [Tepidiformaceae bacterium]